MNFRKRTRSRKNSSTGMNTERWKTYRRKLSRRGNDVFEIQDTDDEEPQYKEIKDWVTEFFDRKSECNDKLEQDIEVQLTKKQTLILSTLLPDEILLMDRFDTSNPKRFVGVLLMADVSGYTALSERYNNTGKGGTYRLTVTLNTYLGSLIELIYSHGGDIVKFAGDAFLALWKTDKRTFLCHTIHTVIACALIIQHSYSSYETDVKVNLKVKLAISAGNLLFALIGTGVDMNFIISGLPVVEAKAAESVCTSGEVKLTPTAWGHCYSRNYDHIIDENGYVTIKSILYDPRENDVTKPFAGFGNVIRQSKKPFPAIENLPEVIWDSSKTLSVAEALKKSETLNLRKTILLAEERNIGSEIRKFIIRPVLTQIDAHQPLEYLTEMRQVSVLFTTLKPRDCSFIQLITIVNNFYQITCEIVYQSMGCVNKIILFDKDVMILVIFGLRGYKHESEAQAALKCAYSIKKSVSALDGVEEVSIGVTTGQVYCGVVGHPLRREFTVIGAIVNKAARLMCGFRNKITCDESTFVKSKMSTNGFTLQPQTELKGIIQPGKIYEYTEEIRVKELYDIPMIPPLLNRVDEMEYFQSWLDDCHLAYRDFDAMLLVGESRIGKSRMLEWMARYAKNNGFGVCSINLTSIHSATAYLALSQIMNQILGLKEPITGFAKEEKIVHLLKMYTDDLCYLNNIMKVRFAYHEGIYLQDEFKRKEKGKVIFKKLIKAIEDTYVIFLDDLQNLDSSSWEFMSIIFSSLKIFTVISVTRGKFSSVHTWLYGVFINNSIRKISLGPLAPEWIAPLACQILDVTAVPNDLCSVLQSKCKGMPGLVESFIIHLFSSGALEINRIQHEEIDFWKTEKQLQFPDPALLHPQALDPKDQPTLDQFVLNDDSGDIAICFVTRKEELNTNINVHNIDALVMIQIDSLTPYQQLLLKIASVIGLVIPRELLENIMYENNPLTTARAVKRLFALRILSCVNADNTSKYPRTSNSTPSVTGNNVNLSCECSFEHDPEPCDNLPKYAFCKIMRFRNRNSRGTCYELLPINQKKEFHTRVVNYLENNKQKCIECGGTIMIVQSVSFINAPNFNQHMSFSSCEINKNDSTESESQEDEEGNFNKNYFIQTQSHAVIEKVKSESIIRPKGNKTIKSFSQVMDPGASTENSLQFTPILKTRPTSVEDTQHKNTTTKRVTMTNIHVKRLSSNEIQSSKFFNKLRVVTEADDINDWHQLGVIDSQDELDSEKNKNMLSIKIEKKLSQTNVAKCTCAEINITICEQLIHHALQADLKAKAIEFLIKYCHLNIMSNSIDNVFEKLEDAENMCLVNTDILESFEKKRFLGKIYSIRAAACLISGKLMSAKLEIERAIKIYGINLRQVSRYFKMKSLMMMLCVHRQKQRINKMILKSDSVLCLNVATMLFSALGDDKISRTTALQAIDIVQIVQCSVLDICETYTNAIQVELDRGMPDNTLEIEQMAIQSLKQLPHPIQADELYAVGRLFLSSFRARMARGQLPATVRSGFRALTVSRFLQADDISIDIIPELFYILFARRRIEEAVDIVQLALQLRQNHIPHECECWYYALCIDMILDAGFQLETPNDISRFAEYSLFKGKSAGASRRRLIVGLWTYWLRVDSERKARRFETEALSWVSHNDDGTMTSLLSAMRLAEGMLESLASKVDDLRKVVDLMELRSIADRELARLENDAGLLRAVYPRWILLKANSLKLSGRQALAITFFNQALEASRRISNRLEEAIARAAISNSVVWMQNARAGDFMHWRAGVEHARASWHQIMYRIDTVRYTSQ